MVYNNCLMIKREVVHNTSIVKKRKWIFYNNYFMTD